ncbi:hypothetical protein X777_03337, partial [Ooceraea biroi]
MLRVTLRDVVAVKSTKKCTTNNAASAGDNAVINTSVGVQCDLAGCCRNDRRDLGTSRSAGVVTAKAAGAITDKRSNRTVCERPLLLMGWTMERHGCRESKSMTNGRPLGKVLCIAGGRAPKFQGRLRRADL